MAHRRAIAAVTAALILNACGADSTVFTAETAAGSNDESSSEPVADPGHRDREPSGVGDSHNRG